MNVTVTDSCRQRASANQSVQLHRGISLRTAFVYALWHTVLTVVVDFDEHVVLARRSAQDLMLLELRCCVVARK